MKKTIVFLVLGLFVVALAAAYPTATADLRKDATELTTARFVDGENKPTKTSLAETDSLVSPQPAVSRYDADTNKDSTISENNKRDLGKWCLLGDMNGDGRVDSFDIEGFSNFLKDKNWKQYCNADINRDFFVDEKDVNEFVKLIGSEPKYGWKYNYKAIIKFRAKPPQGRWCKGDMNMDGKIDFSDINGFRDFLNNHNWKQYWFADINRNLLVDESDINPFVRVLTEQDKPYCTE